MLTHSDATENNLTRDGVLQAQPNVRLKFVSAHFSELSRVGLTITTVVSTNFNSVGEVVVASAP